MSTILTLLAVLCLLLAIVGIVKPSLVIRWGEKKTRLRVIVIYGSLFFGLLVLNSALRSPEEAAASAERRLVRQQEQVEKERAQAKTKLEAKGITFNENNFIDSTRLADTEVLKLFLSAGMDANVHDEKHRLALVEAALYGKEDAVKLLVKAGADVNGEDTSTMGGIRRNAILAASSTGNNSKYDEDYAKIIKFLVKSGANPNSRFSKEGTPLYGSVFRGSLVRAKALLESGADPNRWGNGGYTPLQEAVLKNDMPMIQLLLSHGADPNRKDENGVFTPLELAKSGSVRDLLVKNGSR